MARQSWESKIGNALNKLLSGKPLGKQTRVPATPTRQRAAARGHAAGEYHFGRVTSIKDSQGNIIASRVGPVPDPSGETYRGARGATLDHVKTMLSRQKAETITVCIYGRVYPGDKVFRWKCDVFDREQLIRDINSEQEIGSTVEQAAQNLFRYDNLPDLILAWEVRPHKE